METQHTFRRAREAARALNRTASERIDRLLLALADAVEAGRPYEIDCPLLVICGEKDGAGSAKRYNRAWERREGHVVHWIEGAGHNSCCDRPDTVNSLIEEFVRRVKG